LFALTLACAGVGCSGTPSGESGRITPSGESNVAGPTTKPAPSASPEAGRKQTVPERSTASSSAAKGLTASTLRVMRLVVTSGVKDREPVQGADAFPSDGTPIYAFAELSNPEGESENVRITFEREGGAERVGNVTLPVPARVSRHRTWATTRFIRAAGVWEAVLWNEGGSELARTSFEVGAASS
jgi:hypothetical protein